MLREVLLISAASIAAGASLGCSTSTRAHAVTDQVLIASMRTAVVALREVDGALVARDAIAMQMREQWMALHLDDAMRTGEGLTNTMPAADPDRSAGNTGAAQTRATAAPNDDTNATPSTTSSITTTTTTTVVTTTTSANTNVNATPVPVPAATTTTAVPTPIPTSTAGLDAGALPDINGADAGAAAPPSQTATPGADASPPAPPQAWPGPGPFIFRPSFPGAPAQPPSGAPEAGAP